MATRGLQFNLSTDAEFRDVRVVSVKRLCPLCGDWKDEAFDVCWDPDVRCMKEPDGASDS